MKFSEKMCLKITLKNQGFAFSVEDAFFGKLEPPLPTPPPQPPPPQQPCPPLADLGLK